MRDIDELVEHVKTGAFPTEREIHYVCQKAQEILAEEPNILNIQSPVTIVGDIHAQLFDLLEVFLVGGELPYTKYLFLGDYVDRGYHSTQTMTLLYLLKIKYPTNIYLLRGNHENKQITQVYGMYNEIHQNYGTINAWEDFCTSFDALPLCAIIDEKIFCVHGGLSPELLTNKTAPNYSITPIIELDRYNTNAYEGLAIDLVWSDPEEIQGWSIAPKSSGYLFGAEVVQQFHHSIGTDLLCRSHQLVMEGYKYMFDDGLITIWGAPNYCYRCGNVAAVLEVEGQERRTVVYDQSPKTMEHVKEQTQTQVNYFL